MVTVRNLHNSIAPWVALPFVVTALSGMKRTHGRNSGDNRTRTYTQRVHRAAHTHFDSAGVSYHWARNFFGYSKESAKWLMRVRAFVCACVLRVRVFCFVVCMRVCVVVGWCVSVVCVVGTVICCCFLQIHQGSYLPALSATNPALSPSVMYTGVHVCNVTCIVRCMRVCVCMVCLNTCECGKFVRFGRNGVIINLSEKSNVIMSRLAWCFCVASHLFRIQDGISFLLLISLFFHAPFPPLFRLSSFLILDLVPTDSHWFLVPTIHVAVMHNTSSTLVFPFCLPLVSSSVCLNLLL